MGKSVKNNVVITIITVVYNGVEFIERTIQSVASQTHKYIEYIIIDGGSTDGTVDIIKAYKDNITYWVSEPDKGIYDAMNKGIRAATGDWINFLNAGDTFAGNDTISNIFAGNNYDEVDVVFGNSYKKMGSGELVAVESSADISRLSYAPVYRHSASFVKASVHKANLFDLSKRKFGYALDFYCIKVDVYVLTYLADGISNNPLKNAYYNFLINIDDKFSIKAFIIFVKRIFHVIISRLLKQVKRIFGS